MFLLLTTAFAAPPVAEAGLPLWALPGNVVILNGSASTDPDDDPLAYAWTQISGPPVELSKADTAYPELTVEGGGTYRFELVVTDGESDSDPDMVEVVVPFTVIETGYEGCATAGTLGNWGLLATLGLALSRRRR